MLPLFFFVSFYVSLPVHANSILPINSMANVNQLVQDNKGFIWLAGQQGLTRFDGQQIISFSSRNTDWPLSINWLHDVDIDHDNEHLLLATETDGLLRFNPNTGKAIKVSSDIPRKSFYNVIAFQGDYYINAPDKLYRYQTITNATALIDSNIKIKEIAHSKNHLYVASQSGLYQLKDNRLIQIMNEPIFALTAISSGVIAITKGAITRFNDDDSKLSLKKANNIYAATKEFNTNDFFTVTNQGVVNKFSGETLKSIPHKYGNIDPVRVRSLLHDNSGVLWLVSSQGIQQLTENSIQNHPKVFDIKINANGIAIFKNEIIIGSYGAGLQNFRADVFTTSINDEFSKNGLRITSMANINDILYIGTFDGLWRYDEKIGSVEKLKFPENNKLVLTLRHEDNLLYFGTNYHGAYVYDLATEKIIRNISWEQGLSSPEIIDVLPLNTSYTWLATSSTVDILNNNTSVIRSISLPGTSKVISLIKDDNKIFATTLADGIYAFNLQGDLLAQFGQGVRFTKMLKVNKEIWVMARPGLYRFNPANYQLSMIENTEQYSFSSSMVLQNNVVYASHYSGVLSLDLTTKKKFNPKIHISKTTVSGKSYLLNKAINIDSGNDVITLDLASLDYRPGVNKQYRYTFNGNKWHQINGNQLTLTGLASGDYHIEMMGTNSLGQWSNYKAYTDISVAFPWYWTPQIRLIYGVSIFGIILLSAWLLYLRSKSISHVHNILQKDINNFGKINLQVKRNVSAALTLISENEISKSKLLLHQCVEDLNEQQALPEPNSLNGNKLSEAVPFLAEYLKGKYQVKLSSVFEIKDDDLDYELQADLYRVIYEAITSAILSGNGRSFKIVLQKFKNKIWLSITDDGQSFIHFNSKVNFNVSMYYIRQIANKHNGSINTFNEQGDASQLVLSIPIMHGN
jgi:ligand-binding sensor domain-containing protein